MCTFFSYMCARACVCVCVCVCVSSVFIVYKDTHIVVCGACLSLRVVLFVPSRKRAQISGDKEKHKTHRGHQVGERGVERGVYLYICVFIYVCVYTFSIFFFWLFISHNLTEVIERKGSERGGLSRSRLKCDREA